MQTSLLKSAATHKSYTSTLLLNYKTIKMEHVGIKEIRRSLSSRWLMQGPIVSMIERSGTC